jgi:hypothetical protein
MYHYWSRRSVCFHGTRIRSWYSKMPARWHLNPRRRSRWWHPLDSSGRMKSNMPPEMCLERTLLSFRVGSWYLERARVRTEVNCGTFPGKIELTWVTTLAGGVWFVDMSDPSRNTVKATTDILEWFYHRFVTSGGIRLTFPQSIYRLPFFPRRVRWLDVDGDGDLDIITARANVPWGPARGALARTEFGLFSGTRDNV